MKNKKKKKNKFPPPLTHSSPNLAKIFQLCLSCCVPHCRSNRQYSVQRATKKNSLNQTIGAQFSSERGEQ